MNTEMNTTPRQSEIRIEKAEMAFLFIFEDLGLPEKSSVTFITNGIELNITS
jgi:hypothetical protein